MTEAETTNGAVQPELAFALFAAQGDMPAVQKDAINPHYKNRYVSLDTLMEQVLPVLHKHQLAVLQFPTAIIVGEQVEPALRTVLVHKSGQTMEDTMPLCLAKDDPQGQGSAITYARRYSLMAILGLVADQDDDGAAGSRRSRSPARASTPKPHDPATDLPAGFTGTGLDKRIGKALAAVDPSVDWKATWDNAIVASFAGVPRQDLPGDKVREAWTRLANVADKLAPLTGTFPPPTDEDIQQAFAYAFDGHIVDVVHHVADDLGDDADEPVEPAPLGDAKPDVDETIAFDEEAS